MKINPIIDDLTIAISKLSEGNPGAINACCLLIKNGGSVYPYGNSFDYIMMLDKLGIYGTDIYILWSDICKRDLAKMIAALRIAMKDANKAELLRNACGRQDYSGLKLLQEDAIFSHIFY